MTVDQNDPSFTDSGKTELRDKRFNSNQTNKSFKNCVFTRLVAKKIAFQNVDFSYCTFDACYVRDCSFDSCKFIGCRFVSSNFHGSTFGGCSFEYATFEKTGIDRNILLSEVPTHENQKLFFARSLRTNFQQLGDAQAVNLAIEVELKATELHLRNASFSTAHYYRTKYKGINRLKHIWEYLIFKILDFIWGNGESLLKLLSTVALVVVLIGLTDAQFHDPNSIKDYVDGLCNSFPIFMGATPEPKYPLWYVSLIYTLRLIAFSFFTAIVIKRISRR